MSRWVLGLNLHHDASACLTRTSRKGEFAWCVGISI